MCACRNCTALDSVWKHATTGAACPRSMWIREKPGSITTTLAVESCTASSRLQKHALPFSVVGTRFPASAESPALLKTSTLFTNLLARRSTAGFNLVVKFRQARGIVWGLAETRIFIMLGEAGHAVLELRIG